MALPANTFDASRFELLSLAERLRTEAARAGHRRLLVISGRAAWARQQAQTVLGSVQPRQPLWLGDANDASQTAVPLSAASQYLGRELDLVVFDAHAGFDPDAFAAISGALKGGGLMLLLIPACRDWPEAPDPERGRLAVYPYSEQDVGGRFLRRLAQMFEHDPTVTWLVEGRRPAVPVPPLPSGGQAVSPDGDCRTPDQAAAVEALIHVVAGHRRRPLVLTSDRGRGKSAALGIAVARLFDTGRCARVIVTAPRRDAADAVFNHAARRLPRATVHRNLLDCDGRQLTFVAPDALLSSIQPADLLLVDEAAALPAGLLIQLLERFPRICFSTTVHGYEGTGRGFAVRFAPTLDRLAPGWRRLQLDQPVRWAPADPLENLVLRALLLDAEPPSLSGGHMEASGRRIERLDRDALADDEALLRGVFGLLVAAHYRTTPLDLRHLLDGPNIDVWVARIGREVVGTLLVAREGGFDAGLGRDVWAGERRPRGHLLPQVLAFASGLEEAPCRHAMRIIRIAVHPRLLRRGIGTAMVTRLADTAREEGFDIVGASFAATVPVMGFWSARGLLPVRVGARRETTSGAHSVLVCRGISGEGGVLCDTARRLFLADFPLELGDTLRDLDPGLVQSMMGDEPSVGISSADRRLLEGFAFAKRSFESTRAALFRLLSVAFACRSCWDGLGETDRTALVVRVMQARPWKDAADAVGLSGRARLVEVLRRATAGLLEAVGEATEPERR